MNFDFNFLYTLLGQLVIIIAVLIIILFIIYLTIGKLLIKKEIVIFPKFILFITDLLYSPFKSIAKLLKLDDNLIDSISIQTRNDINKKKFKKIPADKTLIFLPHCLRHKDCPATLQKEGVKCTCCGLCSIGVIKKKAEPMGYKTYIVPGSSFVKKIVMENKFKAVIGVACHEDLNQMMMLLSDFCPQGVLLKKTGCFETRVDVGEVLKIINSKD
ncbi:DUF116 domain-containing protein [Methanobrevibacter millerae]|uniref:DUF116 domain-containing protein n=1 Tax=Methanobrevibacter millerae TaxID=230361 RepID=A0A1G5V528_9EURY|nr:DUF116 domain-containing protein [Methanobrevibacter millerae]SDA40982.1 hypothetical protein SAMN02910315_00383 [Methanobrevibacter millerae]